MADFCDDGFFIWGCACGWVVDIDFWLRDGWDGFFGSLDIDGFEVPFGEDVVLVEVPGDDEHLAGVVRLAFFDVACGGVCEAKAFCFGG